jgi:UDP-N-acetyl-D-mannosaminuronic acid dehydrogenase
VGPVISKSFRRVSIVGLGYIGLPTACMFAVAGVQVVGVDIRSDIVEKINAGEVHIEEQGVAALVSSVVAGGLLRAASAPEPADAFIIAVPTPIDPHRAPDLSCVEAAAISISRVLKRGDLVVLESTAPVGTTRKVAELLARLRPDLALPVGGNAAVDVNVACCPERMIPGHMLRELVENDRVAGGLTPRCAARAAELYSIFARGKIIEVEADTAEMVKLAENAFRDVNIAFANELSSVCGDLGLDAWKVIELANRHPRVSILKPGPGVGGHCIAVDPWFIVSSAPHRTRLIRAAREVNDCRPAEVVAKVAETLSAMPGARIVCMGLTYKPDVDDFRESPSLEIAKTLAARYNGRVTCVDPSVGMLPPEIVRQLGRVSSDHVQALKNADLAVMLVAHSAFQNARRPSAVVDAVGFWKN